MKKILLVMLVLVTGLIFYNPSLDIKAEVIESQFYDYLQDGYEDYVVSGENFTPQGEDIIILGIDFIDDGSQNEKVEIVHYDELNHDVLFTPERGIVTWTVNIPTEGFYNISIDYYPTEGKSSSIERSIFINGEIPFNGARNLIFPRVWTNSGEIKQDPNGNDIKPKQVEAPRWIKQFCKDDLGYTLDPYLFYFDAGENTIGLESIKEPMTINEIIISSYKAIPDYATVINDHPDASFISDFVVKVQGEDAIEKSSPTLYPIPDRSSSLTEPYDVSLIRLNNIGGFNWRIPGDSITWEFDVPADGFYNISMRVKQTFNRGMFASRAIYIDGQIPFREVQTEHFNYAGNWRMQTLGNDDENYRFYLTEGVHTISMEVTLGEFGELTQEVETSVDNLNSLYRNIIRYTKATPDPYRDYELEKRFPEMITILDEEAVRLGYIIDEIVKITGSTNEKTAVLERVKLQLEDFSGDARSIPRRLNEFNSNLSSLGTWILQIREQPLQVDYILVHSDDYELPRALEGFFARIWNYTLSFFASFTTNYSAIGGGGQEGEEHIEVWTTLGRDQANVIRQLIDETFTPDTGIVVDLKLVNGGVLLPATLAGQGPDVAMNVGNVLPVNYALRSAIYDLSEFDDFEEVSERFYESAMVPYGLEDGYYALPEQQIFLMMIYRKDILDELELTIPETWDDVILMSPYLQKHNFDFWLPMHITKGAMGDIQPNALFASLLFQNDGHFYLDDNKVSAFKEEQALKSFEIWTDFYSAHKFPLQASFINRFRNGEIPIGIEYYTVYNTLSVFAPEIRGDWAFAPIPGTIDIDEFGNEYIRRETTSTGTAIVLMNNADNVDASWEYMKWWTSKDTQVQFGREMEGILGAAARYPTANIDALAELPWSTAEFDMLAYQMQYTRGIPQVAGGYLTGRHIDNAFREVINEGSNPREALYDYTLIINMELTKKRKEFGLDVDEEEDN